VIEKSKRHMTQQQTRVSSYRLEKQETQLSLTNRATRSCDINLRKIP